MDETKPTGGSLTKPTTEYRIPPFSQIIVLFVISYTFFMLSMWENITKSTGKKVKASSTLSVTVSNDSLLCQILSSVSAVTSHSLK